MPDDVLVLGGGLVGSLTAILLAEAGCRCTVVDAEGVLRGASLHTAGGLYYQAQPQTSGFDALQLDRLQALSALVRAAADAWERCASRVALGDALYRSGGAILADDAAGTAALREKWQRENAWGLRTEWWDADDVRAQLPGCAPTVCAATYSAAEGYCEPVTLADRVRQALARSGAAVVPGRAVVDAAAAGAGYRVVLEDGERLHASRLLVCLGAFGDPVLRALGLVSGIEALPLQIHVLQAAPGSVPMFLRYVGQRLSVKQFGSGEVLVGGGWPAEADPERAMGVRFSDASTAGNLAVARRILPGLAAAPLRTRRGGWAAWTQDGLPTLGGFRDAPGVYAAYGGNGYTLAPVYAEALAALALGRAPGLDVSAFSPDRHRAAAAGRALPPDG